MFEVARLGESGSRVQDRSLRLVFRKCGPFGGTSHGVQQCGLNLSQSELLPGAFYGGLRRGEFKGYLGGC